MRCDLPLDGSDPLAAPGMFQAKHAFYWRAPRPDIAAGYRKDAIRLPGRAGDGQDLIRAARARELERGLLNWRSEQEGPKVAPNSWRWLIAKYLTDDFSPFREVKENTAKGYRESLAYLSVAIGAKLIADTDYEALKILQRGMESNGRSVAFISRKFTMLRIIANYATALNPREFAHVGVVLSKMRFKKSAPRDVAPTKPQIEAIIAAADKAGDPMFALAISLQWWLTLRAVDVRGHFLGTGKDRRWADGLTWGMIEGDMAAIHKVVSKTAESEPRVMIWALDDLPDIQARLRAIPADKRVGPVILQPDGQPYDRTWFTAKFRRYRAAAGVPDEVKMMDVRAGAITHAKSLGASTVQMQHAAGHASPTTTQRYIRDRGAEVAEVIQLRVKK
ncbi:MAG: recombinase [Chthoniobacter sp.]|nr:recombinase [Chthoniobacter sp.]